MDELRARMLWEVSQANFKADYGGDSYRNFWVLGSKQIWLIAREGFSTTLNLKALNITEPPTLLGQDMYPFDPRENLQSLLTMRTSVSFLTVQQI